MSNTLSAKVKYKEGDLFYKLDGNKIKCYVIIGVEVSITRGYDYYNYNSLTRTLEERSEAAYYTLDESCNINRLRESYIENSLIKNASDINEYLLNKLLLSKINKK